MSIADKISKLQTDITNAYSSIESKGGTIPTNKNTENLAGAIDTITGGGGTTYVYAVVFDSDGGTEIPAQQITENGTANEPTAPTKVGYNFLYWALDGVEYDFSTPITESIILVAVWEEKEYTQVEYIKGTGTQWIETSYTPVLGEDIEIKDVICPRTTANQIIFAAGDSPSARWLLMITPTNQTQASGYYRYFNISGTYNIPTSYNLNTKTTIKSDSTGLYYGDTKVGTSNPEGEVNTTFKLFANLEGTGIATAQMGEVTIKNGDTIKLNLIPCIRNSDNVAGMYDKVSDVFYPNAGTGVFLTGEVVGYI